MNRAVEVSKPAVILKFDLLNDSPGRVTDVRSKSPLSRNLRETLARAGTGGWPITMRGYATIEPGYTVEHKRTVAERSSDCACEPQVSVVSARPVQLRERFQIRGATANEPVRTRGWWKAPEQSKTNNLRSPSRCSANDRLVVFDCHVNRALYLQVSEIITELTRM